MFTEPDWNRGTNQEILGSVACFRICLGKLFNSESTKQLEEGVDVYYWFQVLIPF